MITNIMRDSFLFATFSFSCITNALFFLNVRFRQTYQMLIICMLFSYLKWIREIRFLTIVSIWSKKHHFVIESNFDQIYVLAHYLLCLTFWFVSIDYVEIVSHANEMKDSLMIVQCHDHENEIVRNSKKMMFLNSFFFRWLWNDSMHFW